MFIMNRTPCALEFIDVYKKKNTHMINYSYQDLKGKGKYFHLVKRMFILLS